MSLFDQENNKEENSFQDEIFEEYQKNFLEQKRARDIIKNKEKEINVNYIGAIINIPEFITKINNENIKSILNTDMILFILELCINSVQFKLKGDSSSRKFWEEVGKIKLLSPIINIFKPETLRKYWRLLRGIKPYKIINIINEHKNILNNENIKLLSCINIIFDYILKPYKGIEFFVNKYCGKFINKTKNINGVKEMTKNEQFDEIINVFVKAYPSKTREEIEQILYQNSFDVKHTYFVLKDEKNFGFLSFNKEEDEMLLDKKLDKKLYKELELKRGKNNIKIRKNFLEGKKK